MNNKVRELQKTLEAIVRDDSRYAIGAYVFVRMGLDFTIKRLAAKDKNRKDRNVSAQELLDGIRVFALESFGPMAMTLFEEWGVHSCADFGNIVFNLVDAHILATSKGDKIEDFYDGYDFNEAFVKPFLPKKKKAK
ncbi:MAG: hypothetical protein E7035_03730 [Verrucomicrobiaceae bacterium]|jgi:uncharacterized repeat protein (TIGR04138 family)|nr:hypothetical protein [Verrucomicrobiaceae bacterium]